MFRRTWMYLIVAIGLLLASPLGAMAQEGAAGGEGSRAGLIGLGIGLGLGIAAFGCGMGQGRLAAPRSSSDHRIINWKLPSITSGYLFPNFPRTTASASLIFLRVDSIEKSESDSLSK